jgi:hypothetical protein
MSLRYTAALLLILAGLGAYVYLVEFPREAREERARSLFEIEADSIEHVRLVRGETTVDLERQGDAWQLVAPVQARADTTAVKALVDAVAGCKVEKDLGPMADDLARFGLAEPLVALTLRSGDDEPMTVRVGKAAPVGNAAYIQRGSDGNVLLANAAFRSSVDKQLDDLRDRRLLDFAAEDIRWFEIRRGEHRVRLERGEGDGWQMTAPAGFAADAGAIGTYLSSLSALRVASFVADAPESLETYSLDEPLFEVAFATGDSPEAATVIQFGGEKTETEIYARVDGAPAVYTVNDWAYRNLDKTARDLRDKTLLTFAADDARAIQVIRKNGDDFRLVRDGKAWRVDGVEGTAKKDEVEQYVKDLATLAGYEILSDDPEAPAATYGFDEPFLQVSVFGEGDAPIGSVIVGKTGADGGLQNFNARTTDRPTVVLLRSYVVNRLDRDPSTLIEGTAEPTTARPD